MKGINSKRASQLKQVQEKIGYSFKDLSLLNTALTHSSYSGSKTEELEHNERLEFLGDSILNMTISLYLYKKCKDMPEGMLTRTRAAIVCEQSLHAASESINIGEYLLMSRGEENTGGRKRASILADAFEALIAAVFIDGGINKARAFVIDALKDTIEASISNKVITDYKSFLQEHVQKYSLGKLIYQLLDEKGPDHDKIFEMALYLDEKLLGSGSGRSKKDAQQAAAKAAIENLGIVHE
ncbi:MAG: ribonuclease III [Bacillota bacterium]